jgi:hypothetical protein
VKKVSKWVYFGVLTVMAFLIFVSVNPKGIFSDTLTAGGDTGAHVWWPQYYIDNFFTNFKLFGWSMDYFAGFPAGQFYFPVPTLMVAFLNFILPLNIAFKIVTISGALAMPFGAGFFVKSLQSNKYVNAYLLPAFAAIAVVIIQFFSGDSRLTPSTFTNLGLNFENAGQNQRIMGGILPSTLAGEFSFSIAMAFMFFALGFLVKYLRGDRKLYLPAIFGALTIASHLVVGIALFFSSLTILIIYLLLSNVKFSKLYAVLYIALLISLPNVFKIVLDGERNLINVLSLLPILLLIFAFMVNIKQTEIRKFIFYIGLIISQIAVWLFPLLKNFGYTSTMRYSKVIDNPESQANELLDLYVLPKYAWWIGLGVLLFFVSLVFFAIRKGPSKLKLFPEFFYLSSLAIISLIFFLFWPESHAWNIRFLPFYYFYIIMLGFCGFAFFIQNVLRINLSTKQSSYALTSFMSILSVMLTILLLFGTGGARGSGEDSFLKDRRGVTPSWSEWNYDGYEKKDSWLEYKNIMDQLNTLPKGRLFWERTTKIDTYGSAISLDLIPHFTKGKISSMEGLYFEASGTTAYHFLTAGALASEPSNPMRWPECGYDEIEDGINEKDCKKVEYPNNNSQTDFDQGIKMLKQLGVDYYMATSEQMNDFALNNSSLTLVKTIEDLDNAEPNGWRVYRVKGVAKVEALSSTPLVVRNSSNTKSWIQTGNTWVANLFKNDILAVEDGEEALEQSWQKISKAQARGIYDGVVSTKLLPKVKVSNLKIQNEKISFKVDKVGVPVIVRVSYYPNWKSVGASQPLRASPNFMVVIPTEKNVEIIFETSKIERLGFYISLNTFALMLYFALNSKYSLYGRLKKKYVN